MLGQILNGRYQIIAILGSGGFGRTYLARDMYHSDRPPRTVKQLQSASRDSQDMEIAKQVFSREAEILEQLGTHPQIPHLLTYFTAFEDFFLVQEYIEGYPLSKEIVGSDRWNENQAIEFLLEILPLLDFIHARGVIHRDIKPDNILRRQQDGKLVLVNFGNVKKIRLQQTFIPDAIETVAIGTPGYMASEQLQGQCYFSSDIYSVGVIAIQALIGFHPQFFQYDAQTGEILWPKNICSPALAAVLSRMVSYRFQDRYQSAREVLKTIEQIHIPRARIQLPPISPVSYYPLPADRDGFSGDLSPTTVPRRRLVKKQKKSKFRKRKAKNPLAILVFLALPIVAVIFSLSFGITRALQQFSRSSVATRTIPPETPSPSRELETISDTPSTAKIPDNSCTVAVEVGLNIRARPNGEKIGGMARGERAILTGLEDGNWVEISNPIQGWVARNYLQCTSSSFIETASAPADKGEAMLQTALASMEGGDLPGAIARARAIETESSAYRDAQTAITQWMRIQERYQAMQQAKNAKRWEEILIDLNTHGLPDSPYWRNKFVELGEQARLHN
ncbi:MAG: protein kinase [Spirulina sp.]